MYTTNDGIRFLPLPLRRDFDRDARVLHTAFECLARLSTDRWVFSRVQRYPLQYRKYANTALFLKGKGYIAAPSIEGINLPLLHKELHHFLRAMQIAFRTDKTARATFDMIAKHSALANQCGITNGISVIVQIKEAKLLAHKLRRATKLPKINSSVSSQNGEHRPS